MTDAFLLVSYGAPEGKEDVVPFLENLFSGKDVPTSRIEAAAEKYHAFARQTGQYSPLNDECRALLAGILRELNRGDLPREQIPSVYWGNLFRHPLLEETIAEMTRDGIRHAACFVTSAFDSFASNRRYVAAWEDARRKAGPGAPTLEQLPLPYRHPLFIEAQTDRLLEALAHVTLDTFGFDEPSDAVLVLFSAHSIMKSDASKSDYSAQLLQTCRLVMEQCGPLPWELVFQSRSAGPTESWLGPDIGDRVRQIAQEKKYRSVVVLPIGFFCENMETVNDLDMEIGEICAESGLGFARGRAVGAAPKICRMIREMIRPSR